jgi:hypothetical protein
VPKKDLSAGFDLPELPAEKQRTTVSEKQVHNFVAATPKRSKPATSASRLRREDIESERLNVHVPTAVAKRVREAAFRERRSVSDAVTEALEHWLKRSTRVQ